MSEAAMDTNEPQPADVPEEKTSELPSMRDMIVNAIKNLKSADGVAPDEIRDWIAVTYPAVDGTFLRVKFRSALNDAVRADVLEIDEDTKKVRLFVKGRKKKAEKKTAKKPAKPKAKSSKGKAARKNVPPPGKPDVPLSPEDQSRQQQKLMEVLQEVHASKPSERLKHKFEALYEHRDNETWHQCQIRDIRDAGDNVWEYYIHYLGWSKRYDEWVTTDLLRVLES